MVLATTTESRNKRVAKHRAFLIPEKGNSVNKEKITIGQVVVNVKAEGIPECLDALDDLAEAVERVNQLLNELHQKSNITITGEVVR